MIREQIGKYNKARDIEFGRSKTDVFLQPPCKALQPIRDSDKGESKEKSKASSKLSQQRGERIEQHLSFREKCGVCDSMKSPPPHAVCIVTPPRGQKRLLLSLERLKSSLERCSEFFTPCTRTASGIQSTLFGQSHTAYIC